MCNCSKHLYFKGKSAQIMIGLPLHKNNIIKSAKLFCDQRKIIHLKNKTKKDLLYHADKVII